MNALAAPSSPAPPEPISICLTLGTTTTATHCGNCKIRTWGLCEAFCEQLSVDHNGELKRLPACIAAELPANPIPGRPLKPEPLPIRIGSGRE